MDDVTTRSAVRARDLRKVYRLYRKPSYRALDIMGFLPASDRYFGEHVALHGVNLDIGRGEKVAIIGRNGAGKSTLLRLITGVVQPTAGTVEVRGNTQALLSIGTGFHPELTGRQNAMAYLANFGIAGADADRMLDEIIEFAELEEYIDQPMKTYSTGMGMRLMFSASTMFVPDLLVIDEVLGVGDAYFQAKSFERIREICGAKGATLLLVTHDVYTASTLCERMIWIDNGAVLLDADSPTVLKAYETSIRQQEEARLRKKALLNLQRLAESSAAGSLPLIIELRSPTNTPAGAPVQVGRVALLDGDREVASAALTGAADETECSGRPIVESGAWGEVTTWKDRPARQMNNFGSALHKVGVSFLLPNTLAERADELTLEVETGANDVYRLEAWRIDADLRTRSLGTLPCKPGEWVLFRSSLSGTAGETGSGDQAAQAALRAADRSGSGRLIISHIQFINEAGHDTLRLEHGKPATLLLDFVINDPSLREHCQVVVVFRRNGVDDMFRLFERDHFFDGSLVRHGRLSAYFEKFPLGVAEYTVTVMVAAENYFESRPTLFYSINPLVYWAGRDVIEITVTSDHLIPAGTGVVGEATWTMRTNPDDASGRAGQAVADVRPGRSYSTDHQKK
jgi:homopolymeric O-antigen transport system ATP-binding protein